MRSGHCVAATRLTLLRRVLCRLQLAEIKNGRLAMIAIGGIVHHYLITGKGPVQLLTGA